ncbi:MAG: hypothetical protein H0U70_06440 [Tatlockia sp.]|nr:hypothetical protein [Tatlockia sp.]
MCSTEHRKKYRIPWYRRLFRIGLWRCPEAGIAYLKWAAELKKDEDWVDKENLEFGQLTHQALAAQETLFLYTWWNEKRPIRPDPYEANGWTHYCEKKRMNDEHIDEDNSEISKNILDLCQKIKMEQNEEDTAMLIRLVKLRYSLWT